jgi:hypothetical protein
MRPRLTYANVMATIAVFIALGGSAYAFHLGKNSVGSKQLKKNAVTTAKVKNEAITAAKVKKGTLTGTQIDVSTLGMVPSAVHATSASSANAIDQPEPFHEVGTPGEPQFQNGCSNIGGADSTVAFLKDREGFVHLKGQFHCLAAGKVPFQLPPGYRPARGTFDLFPQSGSSAGSAVVAIAGTGYTQGGELEGGDVQCVNEYCYIDGITFRAES